MLTAIVAMDKNRGIGHDNKLLFRIRPDMQNFKETTITPDRNGIVIMGRKTWESLPKRPLMNRKNVIISNQSNESILGSDREDTWKHGYFGNIDHSASCQVLNMAEVEDFIEQGNRREEMMFIIGGGIFLLLPSSIKSLKLILSSLSLSGSSSKMNIFLVAGGMINSLPSLDISPVGATIDFLGICLRTGKSIR